MRLIKQRSNMNISISHAGKGVGGLTQIMVNIPIDMNKYLEGGNVIDSIIPQSLPDLINKIDAINQNLTSQQIFDISSFIFGGIVVDSIPIIVDFFRIDDAMRGVISFTLGDSEITYT